jgi:hypothetical protein
MSTNPKPSGLLRAKSSDTGLQAEVARLKGEIELLREDVRAVLVSSVTTAGAVLAMRDAQAAARSFN